MEDWSMYKYTQQIKYRSVAIRLTKEQREKIQVRTLDNRGKEYETIGNIFFEPEEVDEEYTWEDWDDEDDEAEIMDVATGGWEWWK